MVDPYMVADAGSEGGQPAAHSPASTKIGEALADALDAVAVINDLLVLLHLAGMSLNRPEGGAFVTGATMAQQHASSLRRHLWAAKQELSNLRQEVASKGAAP